MTESTRTYAAHVQGHELSSTSAELATAQVAVDWIRGKSYDETVAATQIVTTDNLITVDLLDAWGEIVRRFELLGDNPTEVRELLTAALPKQPINS